MAAAADTRCIDPPREFGVVPADPVPAKEKPDIRQMRVQLGSGPYEGSVILLRIKASHQPNKWCLSRNSQLAPHGQARRWDEPTSCEVESAAPADHPSRRITESDVHSSGDLRTTDNSRR